MNKGKVMVDTMDTVDEDLSLKIFTVNGGDACEIGSSGCKGQEILKCRYDDGKGSVKCEVTSQSITSTADYIDGYKDGYNAGYPRGFYATGNNVDPMELYIEGDEGHIYITSVPCNGNESCLRESMLGDCYSTGDNSAACRFFLGNFNDEGVASLSYDREYCDGFFGGYRQGYKDGFSQTHSSDSII